MRWHSSGSKETVVVRTNRGFIFSDDDGASWRMLCPSAFGATLNETVPYAFTSEGRLLVGAFARGLQLASADLCAYETVPGPLAGKGMQALEPLPGTPRAFVAVSHAEDHVYSSSDDGKTWAPPSSVGDFLYMLRVAPTDPKRFYATAFHEGDGGVVGFRLITTNDGGKSFSAITVPVDPVTESTITVIGVDADDPKRAYLRVIAVNLQAPERLLRTDDAGATLTEVLTAPGPMVLRSLPGGPTWLGTLEGLQRSDDGGKTFTKVAAGIDRIGCIEHHDGKLYVCGYAENEFGVRVSTDGGASFSWYLRFPDVREQVACPSSSPAIADCAQLWHDWQVEQEQISDTGGSPGAGGASAGGASPGAGAAGSGSGGQVLPGAGGSAGAPSDPTESDSGCGCRLAPSASAGGATFVASLALVLAARRRRARRSAPPQPSTSAMV